MFILGYVLENKHQSNSSTALDLTQPICSTVQCTPIISFACTVQSKQHCNLNILQCVTVLNIHITHRKLFKLLAQITWKYIIIVSIFQFINKSSL